MGFKTIHCRSSEPGSIIFISHGGGPWPLLGDPRHTNLIDFLKTIPEKLIAPKAIVVISAHWEQAEPTLQNAPQPPMLYDYYGFPEESYSYNYPAPGQPQLAERISTFFKERGIHAALDNSRGFDHGLFVPLMLMYPSAAIPCLQLSLLSSLDPGQHINLGKLLRDFKNLSKEEDILILGSGASFHNLRAFREPPTAEIAAWNGSFENWLRTTMTSDETGEKQREERLVHWEKAPAARYCHPREEHLLPLHVCYGIAGGPADQIIEVEYMERTSSMYIWAG